LLIFLDEILNLLTPQPGIWQPAPGNIPYTPQPGIWNPATGNPFKVNNPSSIRHNWHLESGTWQHPLYATTGIWNPAPGNIPYTPQPGIRNPATGNPFMLYP